MTSLTIPPTVSSFLSLGPKFMLSSFTLLCEEEKKDFWEHMLYMLEGAGYSTIRYHFEHEELLRAYNEHVGDRYYVKSKSKGFLLAAYETNKFLKDHHTGYAFVEGDKGKVVGLLPRKLFIELCDGFIQSGLASGNYKEFVIADEASFLVSVKDIYMDFIAPLNRLHHKRSFQGEFLFVPSPHAYTPATLKELQKMNAYVRGSLLRANWKVPVFRPTLKFHKNPLKVRPVISKRDTPSIVVGRVIRYALNQIL